MKALRLLLFVEVAHGVTAEQRDLELVAQRAARLFELECGGGVPLLPEPIHHFSESAQRAASRCARQIAEHELEGARERRDADLSCDHEASEQRVGVGEHELLPCQGARYTSLAQTLDQGVGVLGGRDREDGVTGVQPVLDELGHGVDEKGMIVVKLHRV